MADMGDFADISYKAIISGSILDVCDVLVKYYDENEQEQSEKANDNWSKTFTDNIVQ